MPRCFTRMEKAVSEMEVKILCDGWMDIIHWMYGQDERQPSFLYFIKNIVVKVREDDVWIASFPKCGTTWTQVIHDVNYVSLWPTAVSSRNLKSAKSMEKQF